MTLLPRVTFALALALSVAAGVRATETASTTFLTALPEQDRSAAGITHLTAAQRSTLDSLIDRDVSAARAGNVVGFAKTFSERRTPDERQQSGLDQLKPEERMRLDALVASAIANRPGISTIYVAPSTAATGHVLSERTAAIVHGQVSLFVGAGSGGRSWYGGSFETEITDPTHHLTLMVGASEIKGRGFRPCYDGYDGRLW